jgi:hypothetical protein
MPNLTPTRLDMHVYHESLPKHAFNCDEIIREAYSEVMREKGITSRVAWRYAIIKHDKAVGWVYDNVGLD